MKHLTAFLLLSACCSLASLAAVPLRWTVETSRAQPAKFDAYQGETLDLEASLQSYGKPLEAPSNYAFYWQTNGMGNAWWSSTNLLPLTSNLLPTNVLRATWLPSYDVGARAYNCFIGLTGSIFRAAFQLRLSPSPGAVPNELPLPQKVIDFSQVTLVNPPWRSPARPLPPYLHELSFDDTYPDDAAWYYERADGVGHCSVRRVGNLLERNYDWTFDDSAEFVVRVSGNAGRVASIGVASVGTNLSEGVVTSGKWSRYYRCLPGMTLDGINANGVIAEINVVSTNGWEGWSASGSVNVLGAVRWALDHGTNAQQTAQFLAANVRRPTRMNFHYMIADERETWIVENGVASNATDNAALSAMTNFRILSGDFSGEGLERYWDVLRAGEPITNAWFTRAYSPDTYWPSEFNGDMERFAAQDLWAQGDRESHRSEVTPSGQQWWQTVHTSVYDIPSRTLRLAVQETDDWYTFALDDVREKLSAKRDMDDLSYVTTVPGGWAPMDVDGHRYDIHYDGYSGWYVEKLTYYPEWGEWYYDDYEWVDGPEDAETLIAHKIWSDETITFTRLEVEVQDSLALVSQIGNQAEIAARNYIQNNDIAKTKTMLRTGRPGEYGTGWGTLHYQFSSDRRWWSMIVPSVTASWTSGGYVDANGNFVSSSIVYYPGSSYNYYRSDPISVRDHTPIAKFTASSGTNGSARCATASWTVGITAGPGASSSSVRYDTSADLDSMCFAVSAEVDHSAGFVSFDCGDMSSVLPIEFDRQDYNRNHYTLSNFRFGEPVATETSLSVKCLYDVNVMYTTSVKTNFTAWCTLNLGCAAESYITTNPDYGRVMTSATRDLFWDNGLKATWKVNVTNGCFFAEIVSTNNVTEGVN